MGTNVPKKDASCLLFRRKSFGKIHQIYSISFKKAALKLQGLSKFKHFDS